MSVRRPCACIAAACCLAAPAWGQAADPPAATAPAPAPAEGKWLLGISGGVLARDGDAAQGFGGASVSRQLGRDGYLRVAGTAYRSSFRQADAVLPSTFYLASLSGGRSIGDWFADAYGTLGWQHYGRVETQAGTRDSQAGAGSLVAGAGLSGGRYLRLGGRWYLAPSLSVRWDRDQALRQTFGATGAQDVESTQTAWTGAASLRVARSLGRARRHVLSLSVTREQTTNGAVAVQMGQGGAGPPAGTPPLDETPVSVGDGWWDLGGYASLGLTRRLWLDVGATRTLGAQSGTYTVASTGLRWRF